MKPGVGRSTLLWESETWEFPFPGVQRGCCAPRRSVFCQSLVSWVVFLGYCQRDSVNDPWLKQQRSRCCSSGCCAWQFSSSSGSGLVQENPARLLGLWSCAPVPALPSSWRPSVVFRVKRRSTCAEPEEYNQVLNECGPQVCICGNSLRKMMQNTVFTQRHLYARGEQGNAENISGIKTYLCAHLSLREKLLAKRFCVFI